MARGEGEGHPSQDEVRPEPTAARSATAFETAVARYGDAVYHVAWNMCASSSDADEITQKTFLSACETFRSLRTDLSTRAWLCGIAVNIALERESRANGGRVDSVQLFADRSDESGDVVRVGGKWPDPADPSLDTAELATLLGEALRLLDPRVRAAFVLYDLASLCVEEIASVLQSSVQEVRTHVHRARLILRDKLDAYFKRGAAH